MVDVGHVRVGQNANTSIGRIRVGQQKPTVIVDPNQEIKVNISLSEITDVSTVGVQNDYVLTYNSTTNKYEFKDMSLSNLRGGIF